MPGKMARSAARQPFRLPKLTAAVSAAPPVLPKRRKSAKFMLVRESSGEYRLRHKRHLRYSRERVRRTSRLSAALHASDRKRARQLAILKESSMSANLTVMGYRNAGLRHTNRIVLAILVALVGLSDPVLSTNADAQNCVRKLNHQCIRPGAACDEGQGPGACLNRGQCKCVVRPPPPLPCGTGLVYCDCVGPGGCTTPAHCKQLCSK